MGAEKPRSARGDESRSLVVRLAAKVTLERYGSGEIVARSQGRAVRIGTFDRTAAKRAQKLRAGLPFGPFVSEGRNCDAELNRLVRRLAEFGLLTYCINAPRDDEALVSIEPQTSDYWPDAPPLRAAEMLVLSRFAYMRSHGDALVLESPRAGALFKICDPKLASGLAKLCRPQSVERLRGKGGFSSQTLLELLADCQILVRSDGEASVGNPERCGDLALWEFHDLLFHARSTRGRHANPLGGTYLHVGVVAPPPAIRPSWPGERIDLPEFGALSSLATLLRKRRSARRFDDRRPITLAELAKFLDGTARALSGSQDSGDAEDGGPVIKPYPGAGARYELELYLAVARCEGLAKGFYHYDAATHGLVAIEASSNEIESLLTGSADAMGAEFPPQILIAMAARFGRMSWKYSSIAYSLILKDVGVLTQSFYLMATEMGLGGCAIGIEDIDEFSRMTGIEFHVEGPVGLFAMGRGLASEFCST